MNRRRPAIEVINAGSSSIKFSLFGEHGDQLLPFLKGQIENLYTGAAHFIAYDQHQQVAGEQHWHGEVLDHDAGMRYLNQFVQANLGQYEISAIGHRIVHGGSEFTEATRLDGAALVRLERLIPLAPLHQSHNLAPIRSLLAIEPGLVQVGCFDTAFHSAQPALAQAFALPAAITERGVKRYGAHGLSYEYIAGLLPTLDPALADARVIVLHLGNGASMCAIEGGRSIATTMGLTPLDGLPMGTRCGNLDPSVLLYLMDEMKMGAREIETLLYKQSGLLGVSGISSDMRTLENSDDPRARLAIDLFVYRIGRELGSLAAAMGGVDAIVFTAGIGENGAALRSAVGKVAAWLGVELDEQANLVRGGNRRISSAASRVPAWVVPTDEELMIARHTQRVRAASRVAEAA